MRVAAALTECLKDSRDGGDGERDVLVLGTASSASDVAPLLRRCFTHELKAGEADLICAAGLDCLSIQRNPAVIIDLFLYIYSPSLPSPPTFHGIINWAW